MKYLKVIFFLLIISNVTSQGLRETCSDLKNNITGVCKQLHDCPNAIENLRKQILPHTCGFKNNNPIVCCPLENKSENVICNCLENCANKCQKLIGSVKKISKTKCLEYAKEVSGIPRPEIDPVGIVGGRDVWPGEFAHMAALGYGEETKIEWQCGGSLISRRFILTAAHCKRHVVLGNVKVVRLGDNHVKGSSSTLRHYKVKKFTSHPNYKPPVVYNDIALIELNQTVQFTTYIQPACLNLILNQIVTFIPQITGWGLTEFGGSPSPSLLAASVQIFSFEECQKAYNFTSRKTPTGIQNDTQICAGGKEEEKDACKGDSGGPLQILDYSFDRLYTIIGITSFGKTCGVTNVPGVYTRVSPYIPWIESIVWP